MYDPGDCLPSGPSAYLTQMAKKGLTFPIPRLAHTPIDPMLGQVATLYGEVINMPAPVFGSIEDAVNVNRKSAAERLMGEFVYVSYQNEIQSGGKKLYEIRPGAYLTGNYISRLGAIPAAARHHAVWHTFSPFRLGADLFLANSSNLCPTLTEW